MTTEEQHSDGRLTEVVKDLKSLSPGEFMSGIKSIPGSATNRIQKLKGLSACQINIVTNYIGLLAGKPMDLSPDTDGYIPLKQRLAAWWQGDDIKVGATQNLTPNNRDIEVSEGLDPRRWSPENILMIQQLWGEGFIEPGGPAFAKKLLTPLKFDPANTLLDLSAGLGGISCILAKEHNLWLDAMEPCQELANAGQQFASRSGMASKVPINYVDFENLVLPEQKYDQIFSREALFMVENKKNIFRQIGKSLKNRGQVLIIDYMLADNNNPQSVKKWIDSEIDKPHPWTLELYQTALSHYGVSIWSTHDLSEEYFEHIHDGWQAMVDKVSSGEFNRKSIDLLMREGEIWLNRALAIEAGDLTVQRIHGVV